MKSKFITLAACLIAAACNHSVPKDSLPPESDDPIAEPTPEDQAEPDVTEHKNESIMWFDDLGVIPVKAAHDMDVPVLLYFYSSRCEACRITDALVWNDPELIHKVNENFVAVKLDVLDDRNAWVIDIGVRIVPTFATVSALGDPLASHEGTMTVETMNRFLDVSLDRYESIAE